MINAMTLLRTVSTGLFLFLIVFYTNRGTEILNSRFYEFKTILVKLVARKIPYSR